MTRCTSRSFAVLTLGLLVTACGGGGGISDGTGGGNPQPPPPPPANGTSKANLEVITFATNGIDGSYGRVDLVDGGNPDSTATLDLAKRNFLAAISKAGGTDLTNDWANLPASGAVAATGFDAYTTGITAGPNSGRIFAANNIYDLFQTTTGTPNQAIVLADVPFEGFTGGDITADDNDLGDGGPGLFSNVPGSQVPKLPVLPYTMGALTVDGSGRGPSSTDQHQFIQIEFPYNLDRDSLFSSDPSLAATSFLGDSLQPDNVFIEARWIQHPAGDTDNVVDQTAAHRPVTGVAVIGGVTAVPFISGSGTVLATIDPDLSNVPVGARAKLKLPNVFTFIAHENPGAITTGGSSTTSGLINGDGVLVLPDPAASPGGGRVFGANAAFPGAVNDFGAAADELAAPIGFVSVRITRLRSKNDTISDPYFHTFPVDQSKVVDTSDPTTPVPDSRSANGTFDRGAAIEVVSTTSMPRITLLDVAKDAIHPSTFSDAAPIEEPVGTKPSALPNLISTRARFRVDFDKEVVPNSVGFSRRFTIHDAGVIQFKYTGNSRPSNSPASDLVNGKVGSPVAPSIYVAINQPAGVNHNPLSGVIQKVNSPFAKSGFASNKDDGSPFTLTDKELNGLVPTAYNKLATLPRGVVPCDIYPLNQNNLQSYIVETLVEMPPNCRVTVGVCMPGLGMSKRERTNRGNFTRSGTVFATNQEINAVGLGDPDVSQKQVIIGNETIVKVNAGPMDLEGKLFYGSTSVPIDHLVDGNPDGNDDNLTTGGTNVARTFRVGADNKHRYINAPVSPQALYLAYKSGGAGVLDLSGFGYNTNRPQGSLANVGFAKYLEVSRSLPPKLTGNTGKSNYNPSGSEAAGSHKPAFGIIGRYTSGGSQGLPSGTESELAIGAAILTGPDTPTPGINEGSSGYESLVFSGFVNDDPSTATAILAESSTVGVVRDIQVGNFLDVVDPQLNQFGFVDPENKFATQDRHRTYNTPLQGSLASNSIADPPLPNPPPLRFPVGLPHTAVIFDQENLAKAPRIIDGNEVFPTDGYAFFDDLLGVGVAVPFPTNGLIQLNPTANHPTISTDLPFPPSGGFTNPFNFGNGTSGAAASPKFVQTGPMPKTATAGALVLTAQNTVLLGSADNNGLVPPIYQSRQQIGNFLFVTDGFNHKVHALNSNTMEIIQSLKLPDPYGMGLSPKLDRLYVSNEADNSLSVVDSNPNSATFMTELKRIPVGVGPRAVCVDPDNEDVFVLNFISNSITIVDVNSNNVRKTLQQGGLNRPFEMACGMRESVGGPAFQSGTYHGYISNFGGNNVLVFQSGPDGKAGIGFDTIIGAVRPNDPPVNQVWREMFEPRGIVYDPNKPLDGFSGTVGAFVAHKDQDGRAVVTRLSYTKDALPGAQVFNTLVTTVGFGVTVFETTAQYLSSFPALNAYAVALPDYNRERFESSDYGTFFNLFNAGATTKQLPNFDRNDKFPLADNILPTFTNGPRWEPDRLYLSISNNIIEVFDIELGTHLKTITTPREVTVMASYYSQ